MKIEIKKKQKIAWIILNRPDKLNAINSIMLNELSEALDHLESEVNVKCIIIKGNGEKAFSSGVDLTELCELTPETAAEFSTIGQQVFSKLEEMSKPVLAAIKGYALGGGLELALACDFRIAADNAELGCPEIKFGLIPAWGGTQRLPLIVGISNAKRLIMIGDNLKAHEASEMGLVDKVVPLNELEGELEKLAQRLVEDSMVPQSHVEHVINSVMKVSQDALKRETEAFVRLLSAKKMGNFDFQRNKKKTTKSK
jgi:enoyl-CoA hydratase/carnithine racemase